MNHHLRGSATISDLEFAQAIAKIRMPMRDGYGSTYHWVMVGDLSEILDIHPNRIRSKLRRMLKRNLAEGCTCGCRGDISLTPKGESLLRGEFDEQDSSHHSRRPEQPQGGVPHRRSE